MADRPFFIFPGRFKGLMRLKKILVVKQMDPMHGFRMEISLAMDGIDGYLGKVGRHGGHAIIIACCIDPSSGLQRQASTDLTSSAIKGKIRGTRDTGSTGDPVYLL